MTKNREVADSRTLDDSDYFISQQFVDKFANEVKGKGKKGPAVKTTEDDDVESETEEAGPSDEGDPTDGMNTSSDPQTAASTDSPQEHAVQTDLDTCVKNWKSASDDNTKRMWSIFDETGVFMSACRHGFILWIIDMIRSGEL